jgi:predicted nucleic acid-binding protein
LIVIDASALVEVVTLSDLGFQVLDRLSATPGALHAPGLIDVEVLHALRRLVRAGTVDASSADHAIEDLRDYPLKRWDHRELLSGAWALRQHISSYDAMYVVLAEKLNAPLLTLDRPLARNVAARTSVQVTTLD